MFNRGGTVTGQDALSEANVRSSAPLAAHPARPRDYRRVWQLVVAICAFQTLWGAAFIWRMSFVTGGQRRFCLFDDAMISMRYADNWTRGLGLVWNAGERIEGFTNFGWTAVMTLVHLLPISPDHRCLVIQILGIPTLWLCTVATVLLARECRLLAVSAAAAALFIGLLFNLAFLSVAGMETGVLTLLVTLGLWRCVRTLRRGRAGWPTLLWFAPAVLVRQDAILIAGFAFVLLFVLVRRGRWWLSVSMAVVVAVNAAYILWRHSYYGDWWPNTYYLKMTNWPLANRLDVGFFHTCWTVAQLAAAILVSLLVVLQLRRWHVLLGGSFVLMMVYQVYAGGDAWPLARFVLPVCPALFVIAGEGVHRMTSLVIAAKTRWPGSLMRAALIAVTIAVLNSMSLPVWLLIEEPPPREANRINYLYVLLMDEIAQPDARIAVGFAGVFPYFSRRPCHDMLGKCDAHIARVMVNPAIRRPGHNKADTRYSLRKVQPDVVLHLAAANPGADSDLDYRPAEAKIDGEPLGLYVRRDSNKIAYLPSANAQRVYDLVCRVQSPRGY